MDIELQKSIEDYYKLKERYEIAITKEKKKILQNNTLTIQQKRTKFKKFKPKCIICKSPGGTIFSSKDGILKAICGAISPCKLDIEINRGNFVNMRNISHDLNNDLENVKTEIIKTKLDLLFNYVNEAETIKKFNNLRPELKALEELSYETDKKYFAVVNNTDNMDSLNEAYVSLFVLKENLKELGNKYDETGKPSIITEMVEKYKTQLEPLVNKIRNLTYKNVAVECSDLTPTPCQSDDIITLIEQPYTLLDLETDLGEGTGILKNVK